MAPRILRLERPGTRRLTAVPVIVLMLGTATGCGGAAPTLPPADQARTVADAYAEALGSGDFSEVPLTALGPTDAATVWTAMTQDVLGMAPSAEVESVSVARAADGTPTHGKASLTVTWAGRGLSWSYATDLSLIAGSGDRWLAVWSPATLHPSLHDGDTLADERTRPTRGRILGAGGEGIVIPRPITLIGVDKAAVPEGVDAEEVARALAAGLRIDPDEFAAKTAAAGSRAFVEGRAVWEEDVPNYALPPEYVGHGVSTRVATRPLPPAKFFARPLLGEAGEAGVEAAEATGGEIEAGDIVGLSGLQHQYDARLRGMPGEVIQRIPADPAAKPEVLFESPAEDGRDVVTTLDIAVQEAAEAALVGVDSPSGLVAIRPSTGEVLAVASGFGSLGVSTATAAEAAPGAVFLVVSALALLRTGMDLDGSVECPPSFAVDGVDFAATGPSRLTLAEAVAFGCETAFAASGALVGEDDLTEAATTIGFGRTMAAGIDVFPGALGGGLGAGEHALALVGRGPVRASPFAMASVAASIAAGGQVSAVLVTEPQPSGSASASEGPPLQMNEALQLDAMMRLSVTDGPARVLSPASDEVAALISTTSDGAWILATVGDLALCAYAEDPKDSGPLTQALLTFLATAAPEAR